MSKDDVSVGVGDLPVMEDRAEFEAAEDEDEADEAADGTRMLGSSSEAQQAASAGDMVVGMALVGFWVAAAAGLLGSRAGGCGRRREETWSSARLRGRRRRCFS